MNNFEQDLKNLENIDREKYIKIYHILGDAMWDLCDIPTVEDFANILTGKGKKKEESTEKLRLISEFTGNFEEIMEDIKKTEVVFTDEDSNKHIDKVLASNVTDISESGFFYKKLISSCDNIKIIDGYCGSEGKEVDPSKVDEEEYNFRYRNQFINEIGRHTFDYLDFSELAKNHDKVHVLSPLYCNQSEDHRKICSRCAGCFYRNFNDTFTPYAFGIYSTLMITEKATQASLDSMNKGKSESVNKILESKLEIPRNATWEDVKKVIEDKIEYIGAGAGIMSKFYEVALISRFLLSDGKWKTLSMQNAFLTHNDTLGNFIYRPSVKTFRELLSNPTEATSIKSAIMFDDYSGQ